MPVAIPPDSEVAEEPAPGSAERLSYLDAGGRLASRETAQFAVVRDFDDRWQRDLAHHRAPDALTHHSVNRGRPAWPPPLASRMRLTPWTPPEEDHPVLVDGKRLLITGC
jgi:hypothetical protein